MQKIALIVAGGKGERMSADIPKQFLLLNGTPILMRTLESSVSTKSEVIPFTGWTNIFLFPPHTYQIANCMLTNFHLPKSSLMMQVAAFSGLDLLKKAYKEGMKKKYNFHTYGDAMLIL